MAFQVLTAMDEQLTELLPPVAVKMVKKFKNAVSESQAATGNSLWQPTLSDISEASARSGRDAWLCHSLCSSLLDIHMLLLQKAARDFSAITLGFSRSALASLLRQQQVCFRIILQGFVEWKFCHTGPLSTYCQLIVTARIHLNMLFNR